jgi:hypothetical protein
MEKLERVRRTTCRRMDQVDSELERFEERPELDTRRRYTSLLKRLVELEKLYYNLLRKQAPNPYDLIERILAQQSRPLVIESELVVSGSALNIGLEGSAYGN